MLIRKTTCSLIDSSGQKEHPKVCMFLARESAKLLKRRYEGRAQGK